MPIGGLFEHSHILGKINAEYRIRYEVDLRLLVAPNGKEVTLGVDHVMNRSTFARQPAAPPRKAALQNSASSSFTGTHSLETTVRTQVNQLESIFSFSFANKIKESVN